MKKYIVLLRKINAGKENRIGMKSLKQLFELLGYDSVVTYINSGNVIFNSKKGMEILKKKLMRNCLSILSIRFSLF